MAKIRLEWVRPSRADFQRGGGEGFAVFSGEQTMTVSSTAVLSAPAPAFTGADGIANSQGMARVSVLSGAVVIAWGGASPTVTETTGVRLETGQVQLLSVDTGDALAFIEAADSPSARMVQDVNAETSLTAITSALAATLSVRDAAAETSLTSIASALAATLPVRDVAAETNLTSVLGALQASLAVTTSPIHAISTARSGVLASANTAQDLMPANTARNGWTIQNQSTGNIYLRSKGAAGTTLATLDQNSLIIPPGAAYDPPKVSPHALSIIGSTAGQAFFAEEW
jgi:hypothetical protein